MSRTTTTKPTQGRVHLAVTSEREQEVFLPVMTRQEGAVILAVWQPTWAAFNAEYTDRTAASRIRGQLVRRQLHLRCVAEPEGRPASEAERAFCIATMRSFGLPRLPGPHWRVEMTNATGWVGEVVLLRAWSARHARVVAQAGAQAGWVGCRAIPDPNHADDPHTAALAALLTGELP